MKQKFLFALISCLLIVYSNNIFSQNKLTLNDAIKVALENNYDIKLSKSNAQISDNNYSIGNAGFLPKLDVTGSKTRTVNNTKQEYSSGQTVDKTNAGSNSTNAGIALNWTIFDGLKMFTSLSKLKEYKELGDIQLRSQIENSISDVIQTYYDIVRQNQNYKAASESVSISEERLKIAQEKFMVGSASKLEVLRAQVDLNSDKSSMLNQETSLNTLKVALNVLLARSVTEKFEVADSIDISEGMAFDKIKTAALEKNVDLIQAEKSKIISSYDVSSNFSDYLPKVNLSSGYNYLKTEADAGLTKSNRSYGYTYGINFSWNLFNGFNTNLAYQNAKINFEKNIIYLDAIKNEIEASLQISYKNYEVNLEILQLEKTNVSVSKENLDLAIEELRLGAISPVEFRDVQKSYFDAQSRLYLAQFNAKMSEKDLLKQSGMLIR